MDTASNVIVEKTTSGRTALNFWVDLVTAVAFLVLLGTSTLMRFILPPGTCDGDGVKVWLTHSRHWWGDIHFWVAMLMLVLMVVHVWLHWGWVVRTWGKLVGSGRAFQTWALVGGMLAVLVVPFAIPAEELDVMVAPDHYMAIGEEPPADLAGVAPCGIEGLSCADCPAANDRLFGGGCAGGGEADKAGEETSDCESGSDCSTCEFATQCGSADEEAETAEDQAAACESGSDCAGCDFAAQCGSGDATTKDGEQDA